MSESQLTWIGLRVEDCLIEELIAQGPMSLLFRGVQLSDGETKVFKLARPKDEIERITNGGNTTHAKAFFTGGSRDIRPDPCFVLEEQVKKLTATRHSSLISVERVFLEEGLCYYQMPFIGGDSLRTLIDTRIASLAIVVKLARALRDLQQSPFGYHGDLKPENILVFNQDIILIDPGYLGWIESMEGRFQKAAITTPRYYPFLDADDLFALGVIMWEIALGIHPFDIASTDPQIATAHTASTELERMIGRYESIGNFYPRQLRHIKSPRLINTSVSREVESILLKALRLEQQDRDLDLGRGYSSYDELIDDLDRFSLL